MNAPPQPRQPPLRVVLVEDDAMVRQLLEMVWEEFELELVSCTRVSEALAALRQTPADLIVTDLMLPGESGLDLLAQLAAEPALRGTARLAVFSAGINDGVRAQLRAFDVWRVLHKPLPIAALLACAQDAGARPRPLPGEGGGASTTATATTATTAAHDLAEAEAVARHFGGNQSLHDAFRQAALQQFVHDLAAGDAAVQGGDAPALHRLAHSLKSVLQSLGQVPLGRLAAALEGSAERADWPVARAQWTALRSALSDLAGTRASHALHTAAGAAQQSVTPPAPGP